MRKLCSKEKGSSFLLTVYNSVKTTIPYALLIITSKIITGEIITDECRVFDVENDSVLYMASVRNAEHAVKLALMVVIWNAQCGESGGGEIRG